MHTLTEETACAKILIGLTLIAGTTLAAFAVGAEAAPRGSGAPLAPGAELIRAPLQQGGEIPGELLVGFRRGVSAVERSAARRDAGVTARRALRVEGVQLVEVGPRTSSAEAIARLERDPSVRFAEPNRVRLPLATQPNDPSLGSLWGLHNFGQTVNFTTGTPDKDIDAPEAWDLITGGDTLVAVVDEGVAYDHPDLAPNMWRNPGEVPGNGIDDDGNGHADDVFGIDTLDGDSDPRDFGGHGTHVAGTIAAAGNNGVDVTGVSWRARLMAVRALGSGGGSDATVAEAFDYAGDMGARVVNASLGGPGASATLQQSISDHPNTLFVVAAGNDGANNEVGAGTFPCNFTNANLICVAATTQSDGLASFSNYGATSVDLGAPGTNILSAAPDRDGVRFSDGFEANDFSSVWLPNASSGGPMWNRTNVTAASGGFSAADSPAGNYANSRGTYMDLLVPLDVSAEHGCKLSFDARLQVLAGDRFAVYASFNGVDFDLIGASDPGTGASTGGSFASFDSDLGADGQDEVIVSFGIESNASGTEDGAYVDNVEVGCIRPEEGAGDLAFNDGTSMASPHVAGAAALLMARRTGLSVAQVRTILLSTGDAIASLSGNTVTGRRLNLDGALRHPDAGGSVASPQVSTGVASGVTHAASLLNGTVNPRGAATSYVFEHGTTTAYGGQTPIVSAGSSGSPQPASAQLNGLAPSTLYHYRVVALRGSDTYPGEDRTFSTTAAPIVVPDPGPTTNPGSTTNPGTTTGTSTGTGAGTPAGTSSPLVALRRIAASAKARCRRSNGKPACTVTASGAAKLRLELKKGSRTLARGRGRIGKRIVMTGRRIRPGRYTLVVTVVDSAGRKATVRRAVRIR